MSQLVQIRRSSPRHRQIRRGAAALLCLLVGFASVVPAFARAAELESQGEGTAPPGGMPGLEEGPELEPVGEETALEEAAPALVEEVEQEVVVPEAPAPPPEAPPSAETAVEPTEAAEAPPPELPPPNAPPSYEQESGPSYEAAPANAGVVENETLAAPPSAVARPQPQEEAMPMTRIAPEPAPPPSAPLEAPARVSQPVATPVGREEAPPTRGHDFHVVRPGESLWSVASALLPLAASNAEIAAEVQRLWQLNQERIGTGDPSLIYAGTVLRLN